MKRITSCTLLIRTKMFTENQRNKRPESIEKNDDRSRRIVVEWNEKDGEKKNNNNFAFVIQKK